MSCRCPGCGCELERLPEEEPGGPEKAAVEAFYWLDDLYALLALLVTVFARAWPWSRRTYWCPGCRKAVTR